MITLVGVNNREFIQPWPARAIKNNSGIAHRLQRKTFCRPVREQCNFLCRYCTRERHCLCFCAHQQHTEKREQHTETANQSITDKRLHRLPCGLSTNVVLFSDHERKGSTKKSPIKTSVQSCAVFYKHFPCFV